MQLRKISEIIKLKREYHKTVDASDEKGSRISFYDFASAELDYHSFVISIHLGIDFGTRFTKVCFRHLEDEQSGFISLIDSENLGFAESSVKIFNGKIFTPADLEWNNLITHDEYIQNLKMLMLETVFSRDSSISLERAKLLVVFYLSKIIQHVRVRFLQQQKERIHNKHIHWSGSVGLPVSYYDSDKLKDFDQLVKTAWKISEIDSIPNKIDELSSVIRFLEPNINYEHIPCQAVPELVASVVPFVFSQAAVNTLYIFIDIGGGTFDIAAFSLTENRDKEKKINIIEAQIGLLGVDAIIEALSEVTCQKKGRKCPLFNHLIKTNMFDLEREHHGIANFNNEEAENKIKSHVASAIMQAKKKDDHNWFSEMQELHIFLAGGGSSSPWFIESIKRAYSRLKQAGIKKFHFRALIKPDDLFLNGDDEQLYTRLSVAYGLSRPAYEYPQVIGFPAVNPILVQAKNNQSFDYDSKARDNYGEIL
jgi:hypothetical protein